MTNSPECLSTSTDRERSWHRPLAILLLVAASAAAFIGRGVISADGIEVVAVTLGFFVDGKFEAAMPPTADLLPVPPFSSHYGIFPSFLPVPFLAPAWPFRTQPDEFLSPLLLRTALGLAPVSPFSVRILERTAAAYIIRGRPESAIPFAEEAVRIEPRSGAARLLLGEARRLAGKENAR